MPTPIQLAEFFDQTVTSTELNRIVLALGTQGRAALSSCNRQESAEGFNLEVAEALERRRLIGPQLHKILVRELSNWKSELDELFADELDLQVEAEELEVRFYDPGDPPLEPWPDLDPCAHPAQLGGRRVELDRLRAAVEQPGILCISAVSGAGKSSLLRAGLQPKLGLDEVPCAYERHPSSPGLLRRLARDLVCRPAPAYEVSGFLDLVEEVTREARAPVLILDQLEELFLSAERKRRVLPVLARLLCGTRQRGLGCTWVLAYREEFQGHVGRLLRQPMRWCPDAPPARRLEARRWPLPLLGDAVGREDRAEHVATCFEEAMLAPLQAGGAAPLERSAARRLAQGFARARVGPGGDPDAPLTPELQVVLRRLHRAAAGGALQVPINSEEVDDLLRYAVADHVRAVLTEVIDGLYGDGSADLRRSRRTEGLLLLHTLVDDAGRRRRKLHRELAAMYDERGRALLEAFSDPGAWLLRTEVDDFDQEQYVTLPHDRLAAEIRRMVEDPEAARRYGLDPQVVGLWQLVQTRTASRGIDPGATTVDEETMRRLEASWEALPQDEASREWWGEAKASFTRRQRERLTRDVRSASIPSGRPLRALVELQRRYGLDGAALAEVLRCDAGFDAERRERLFGFGTAALSAEERAALLPELCAALAPELGEAVERESAWGGLLAALDSAGRAGRDAQAQVVEAMRGAVSSDVPVLDGEDGSWSARISGRFEVGRLEEDDGPRHSDEARHRVRLSPYRMARCAVSISDYQRFAPGHLEGWTPGWPVLRVSWYQARAYAAWRGAALPTEHQWEVACRGGNAEYSRGASAYGNMAALKRSAVLQETHDRYAGGQLLGVEEPIPVDPPPRHPLGLHHIHGNVFEWCADWFAGYDEGTLEDPGGPPVAPPTGWRVLRGGSWNLSAALARSAYRDWGRPSFRCDGVGFRLVLPQPVGDGT